MADANTTAQVEVVITACTKALDQICAILADRDLALHVMPASLFLPFAATSQLLKQTPQEQIRWLNAGLGVAAQVLGTRASAPRYGRGRRCSAVTKEMAQRSLDLAKEDLDKTNLVVNRKAARETLLYRAVMEYAVVAKLLDPTETSMMFGTANELIAELLKAGYLERNVVRIK